MGREAGVDLGDKEEECDHYQNNCMKGLIKMKEKRSELSKQWTPERSL